jgi:diguanylate cyclase (GGDEF)-like protein
MDWRSEPRLTKPQGALQVRSFPRFEVQHSPNAGLTPRSRLSWYRRLLLSRWVRVDTGAMGRTGSLEARAGELFERATRAATDEECRECIAEIERLLSSATSPADRGRLLMCRARVRSNQWRTAEVYEDARAAMRQFERAGEDDLVADAASWAAAHASRLGELSVASELATRSLLALESVEDDRVRLEILNRLGIFCVSFLDYDRAIEQFEASLAAAERIGDRDKISRQLQNIGDGLVLAARQRRLANVSTGGRELERAEAVVRALLAQATDDFIRRSASYRLLAEVLCERGCLEEALEVLDRYRDKAGAIALAAQRAALAWVEARCRRLAGRSGSGVVEAERAVAIARGSDDDHELMLALEELAACQEAAGDATGALATAREVKAHMWSIHQRQTRQLVREVWARADFVRDQATLQSQAAEASRRAEQDALTGIGNRRNLERFLGDEAHEQRQIALVVVDVDHFKLINDTFGHRVGDGVLRRIGHLLRDEMRAHQVAVRYGGDEFVLGLLGVDLKAAAAFAERLRSKIEELDWSVLAPELRVTASLGVANGARRHWRAVFSLADAALYQAKREGRNRVVTAQGLRRAS